MEATPHTKTVNSSLFIKQMKKIICCLVILILFLKVDAQNQGISNHWLLGYQSIAGPPAGISHFNYYTGALNITYDSLPMSFNHTEATISDTAGNLLFYTNGYYIADATHDTMMNGSDINPGAYRTFCGANADGGFLIPQAVLILPVSNSNHLYYMFHNTADAYPIIPGNSTSFKFYLTVIDMNLNSGFGAVTTKNQILITDSMNVGKITACKHGNGRDWWIFIHRVNSNMFYKFLITPDSIIGPTTQNIGCIRPDDAGQAKFSSDGKRFTYYVAISGLDIFDFDRCTGDLSNWVHDGNFSLNGGNTGCEFSPNSDVLYVSNIDTVYQYDLTAANVLTTKSIVAVYDGFNGGALETYLCVPQLAPDGKIYITTGNGTQYMHVINEPDSLGVACNLVQHGVQLPSYYFNTLPNPPNFFLGADTNSVCDSLPHVGITENKQEPTPKLFPNPTDGKFTLWFAVHDKVGLVQVYDVNGNLLLQEPVVQWSQYKHLVIAEQPTGIYFVKMSWGNKTASVKVIKE